MTIKVFVVVTGLALAQLNESDGVSIDFPLTKDFLVPGDFDSHTTEEVAWPDSHDFKVFVRKNGGPLQLTLDGNDQLKVSLSGPNAIKFKDATKFPDFKALHGQAVGGSRPMCQSSAEPATCQALSKPNPNGTRPSVALLAARAQLAGDWTLKAGGENEDGEFTYEETQWPLVRFRTPTWDPSNSMTHPFAGGHLASILVFAGESAADKVTVTLNGTDHEYGLADLADPDDCNLYEDGATKCIVVLLTNHRPCADPCDLQSWAQDGADVDFLQLYRLLDVYNPRKDVLKVRPMMPYPAPSTAAESAAAGGGGSSPRCYPAVKTR